VFGENSEDVTIGICDREIGVHKRNQKLLYRIIGG
jgi:hypothetical protein